jgi:hypothetical protein
MKNANLTNNKRLGLFLTAILLTNFCLAQTKYEKDLEFNINFSSDSVIRLSKNENSELFNAVKKIVYVGSAEKQQTDCQSILYHYFCATNCKEICHYPVKSVHKCLNM